MKPVTLACAAALNVALVAGLASLSTPVQAVSVAQVITTTAQAYPSCLSYRVEGVCFFLRCIAWKCSIVTSLKVSHYVPDVVVSTYNNAANHPWTDLGKAVAGPSGSIGSGMMGSLLDQSAGGLDVPSTMTNFKSADAIANPAGMLTQMMSGENDSSGNSITFPNANELQKFYSQELPNIQSQWSSVPSNAMGGITDSAQKLMNAPNAIMGKINSVGSYLNNSQQSMDVSSVVNTSDSQGAFNEAAGSIKGMFSGGNAIFCPGGASYFALHYQSELDSTFWRGLLPLESLYPQTWIPGMGEVGSSAIQTWGSVYPRVGELVQAHPVKNSAVISERVASIIYKSAQPHIYAKVEPKGNFKYFNTTAKMWQMLHPKPATNCVQFGSNDSLALTSFGDAKTDPADGYSWNLWKHYICCQRRGVFLFSVP